MVGRSPHVLVTVKALWDIFSLNKDDFHGVVIFIDEILSEVLPKTLFSMQNFEG